MDIYVEHLSPDISEQDLKDVFAAYGVVASVMIARDKATGAPKDFAFVLMPLRDEGLSAIKAINGRVIKGQTLRVSETTAREEAELLGAARK